MNTKKWFCSLLVAIVSLFGLAMLASCGESKTPSAKEETGVYYYVADYDEYTISLDVGDKFSFIVKGTGKSGTYVLDGETLTFTFGNKEDGTIAATYKDNAISLTYEGEGMRFLKKIEYTVKFETGEGSSVSDATVINGKTAAKPADPARSGYVFTGWYKDSECKTPFDFAVQQIMGNTTVYAGWKKTGQSVVGQAEYEVSFDLNYEGAEKLESAKTIGGKLYDLPETPVRDGYTFVGWWVSMSNRADELSYQFDEEATLGENTTLFAVWNSNATSSKLSAPAVSVYSNKVEWVGNSSANGYQLKIVQESDGAVIFEGKVDGTSYDIDFSAKNAGDYTVTVTALAASGEANNSDPAVRLYKNKALDRVSLFEVTDSSVLVFNRVPNAESYYVTLVCGSADHNHVEVYNGNSTVFNFANCAMSKDGLQFTVRAHAEGYADSVSEVFTFTRNLAAVSELVYNAENETVVWDSVPFATNYVVTVKNGDTVLAEVNVGTATNFSLKGFEPANLTVSVVPKTFGYNSPEAAEKAVKKDTLAAPENLRVEGTKLVWDEVAGAVSYEVEVAGKTHSATASEFDLSTALGKGVNVLRVRALPAENSQNKASLYSDAYSVGSETVIAASLGFENGVLSWAPVFGADGYTVTVNGKQATVSANSYDATANLRAGENVFTVKYNDAAGTSNTVEYRVFLYTVTVTDSGNATKPLTTLYKRAGDTITLTHGEKLGYVFDGWYNVPGGAEANGAKYEADRFEGGSDLYLYAYYAPKTVTVTLKLPDGTVVGTQEVKYDRPFTLPVIESEDPDKEFDGYNGLATGAGAAITDSQGLGNGNWKFTSEDECEVFVVWRNLVLVYTPIYRENTEEIVGYSVKYNESMGYETYSKVFVINIPQTYKGKPILEIPDAAFSTTWTSNIREITFYNTVQTIGANAFGDVDSFTGKCESLEAVNVLEVEGNKEVRYVSEDGVLFDYGKVDDQTSDRKADLIFVPAKKSGTYRIPDFVKTINPTVFKKSNFTEITIPTSVTTIGNSAFINSVYLESVIFENLEATENVPALTIQDRAFDGCNLLTSITLPARVGTLPLSKFTYYSKYTDHPAGEPVGIITSDQDAQSNITDLFYRCDQLKEIVIAGNNSLYKTVDGVVFNKTGDTLLYYPVAKKGAYEIPTGVKTVARGAFFQAQELTALTVHGNVTLLDDCSFYGCPELKTVTVKSSIASAGLEIGKNAFRSCPKLDSLVFEDGANVKVIGVGAFMRDHALTNVELPSTVTNIRESAFESSSGLQSLKVKDSTSETATLVYGDNVFSNCENLTEVYLPAQATNYPYYTLSPQVTVTISPNNKCFALENGVLFNADKTELITLIGFKTPVTTYTVPSTVKKIDVEAFKGAEITGLVISASVEEIGDSAFEDCAGLETVTFVSGGTEDLVIGDSAFSGCNALTAIEIPARTKSIGSNAFFSLVYDYGYEFADSALSTLTFEKDSRLETIGENAFTGTFITSVIIPKSVKKIDYEAFAYTGLQTVSFEENSVLEIIGEEAFYTDDPNTRWGGVYGAAPTIVSITNIPKSVKEIRAFAFAYQANLETVTFEAGGTEDLIFGDSAEGREELDYAYDEEEIERTYSYYFGQVFVGCDKLASIELPARTVQLGYGLFLEDGALKSVSFKITGETEESRLTFIEMSAFRQSGIESIVIPKSVTNDTENYEPAIRRRAFEGCIELKSITFESGNNQIAIGKYAFKDCTALESIELPAALASIYIEEYEYVPALARDGEEITSRVNVFDGCEKLASITVAGTNALFASENGMLYTSDFSTLIKCPQGKTGEFALRSSLKTFADGSLAGLSGITSISVPKEFDSLTLEFLNSFVGRRQVLDENGDPVMIPPASWWDDPTPLYEDYTSVESITVDPENPNYSAEGLIVYDKNKTKLLFALRAGIGETVEIPASVEEICEGVFANCSKLKTVTLPASLITIGASAFENTGITQIAIPKSVRTMGEAVFKDCSDLETITFADGCELTALPADAFTNCASLTAIKIPAKVTEVPAVFNGCDALETVTFETGSVCTKIADYAFKGKYVMTDWGEVNKHKLQTVELPDSLTYLGEGAFQYCYDLVSVGKIPDGVTKIQNRTFEYCEALTDISLGSKVEELGPCAFYSNKSLTSLEIPATVKIISEYAFCEDVKINLSFKNIQTVEQIGERAFYDCKALVTFTIPDKVTEIPQYAFAYCSSLSSVVFHDKITTIGGGAFDGTALTQVVLPADLQRLEFGFRACPELTTVTIGKNVSYIDGSLFSKSPKLDNIVVSPENGTFASYEGAVYNKALSEVVLVPAGITEWKLPAALQSIPSSAFRGTISSFDVPASSNYFALYDGVLYTKDFSSVVKLPAGKEGVLKLPDGFTQFDTLKNLPKITGYELTETNEDYASYQGAIYTKDFSTLVKVPEGLAEGVLNLPSNCTIVRDGALNNTAVKKLVISAQHVEGLTGYMVSQFEYLQSIQLEENSENYQLTEDGVLYNKAGTTLIAAPRQFTAAHTTLATTKAIDAYAFAFTELSGITLNEGLETIGERAFYKCDNSTWKVVNIPDSVTEIDCTAFDYAEHLEKVIFANLDVLFTNLEGNTPFLNTGWWSDEYEVLLIYNGENYKVGNDGHLVKK